MAQFTLELTDEELHHLIQEARLNTGEDIAEETGEFLVDDYAGGNIDDAYELGGTHADRYNARFLLNKIGVNWVV